jgi:hypothetical protein
MRCPRTSRSIVPGPVLTTAVALALGITVQAIDVRVERDKAFDFGTVRTWGWNDASRGAVMMARTREDDPAAMKARAEPVILDAVTTAMMRTGLQQAAQPDLTMKYYLLLTINTDAQTLGQFLPATTMWGLPPFAPATQSLTVMHQGSLVIDLTSKGEVVWRGAAETQIKIGADERKQEAALRDGVRDLLKKYPSKR